MNQLEKDALQEQIVQWIKDGQHDRAVKGSLQLLNEEHDDPAALFQLSKVMLEQNNRGLAYNLMARAAKIRPDIPEMWLQFGQTQPESPEGWGKAEWCFRKAIKLAEKIGKQLPQAWSSLGSLAYLKGDYDEALKHLEKGLAIDPGHDHSLTTSSFVRLARGEWSAAWVLYDKLLGGGRREKYAYGDEPEWDGTPGKRVIISAEQGIGDEIMYGSCIQECIDMSSEVVIECMPRLEKMFKRSFPDATAVYGTRWDKNVVWEADHNPEAHVAMATLPKFFRQCDSDFPGDPYLTPDPDVKDAVRGLWNALGPNPKVGIAWTGGTERTRGHLRERTLEEWLPFLRIPGIDFISLEYYNRDDQIAKFRKDRGIPIHVYHWLTERGLDYDLTGGLISELDLLISVPTTGVQMAGAVGVEAWCVIPKYTGWLFARDVYPWASSVVPMRNPSAKQLEEKLREWLFQRNKTAA